MKNAGLGMPEQHQQQPKRSNRKRQFNQGIIIIIINQQRYDEGKSYKC